MSKLARLGDAMIEHPAITLLVIWLLQMAYLGALQLAGLPFGFAVWPMGEDRNWLRFMQEGPGLSMMHEFWAMNDRNPLSPWWYWLFRGPIYHTDYALYLIRKLIDPFLAINVTLLLGRLFRNRGGPLPLLAGLLVLNFNFSDYREQIVWNFLLALGIALAATNVYLRHVDGKPSILSGLGISLWLFLLAIATYTLDIGILAAIAAIALLRVPLEPERGAIGLHTRVAEFGCFVAVAVIFIAIWYTMSRASSSYYALDLTLVSVNVLSSLRQFLWHSDFSRWFRFATADRTALIAAAGMLALLTMPVWIILAKAKQCWQVEPPMLGWTTVLLFAIGGPIVALESTSNVWLPGYRSRMIYQVSAPLIAVFLIGAVCLVARRTRSGRWPRAVAGVGFLCALVFAVPASIEYNHQLIERTAIQRAFGHALVRLANDRGDIRSFIVRYAGGAASQWASDVLSDTYIKTITRRDDLSMRLIPTYPAPKGDWWSTWWRVVLGPDDEGVRNYAPASTGSRPYRLILFVDWDGSQLSVPSIIERKWFDGLQVDWKRAHPIVQQPPAAPTCPSNFDFSTPPLRGRGWSVPERDIHGAYAMWMSSTQASMELRTACTGPVDVSLAVAGYMAEDILNGLALRVDGTTIPLRRSRTADGKLQLIGRTVVPSGSERMAVTFDAPRTVVPAGGNRNLAVMFGGIAIAPSERGSERESR